MTVSSFTSGDLFTIRITKSLATNPDNAWANSYEFAATDPGTEADLLSLANKLVIFEQNIHRTVVIFQRALISTWEADSVPYNPATFISSTLTGLGLAEVVDDLVALNQCLSVTRVAATGRVGHLFYRGVLEEAQVTAPAGVSVLSDRAAWQTVIDDAITESGLNDYIGADAGGGFYLAMVSADGAQVRPVIELRAQGVATVKTDHAWFNRTSP